MVRKSKRCKVWRKCALWTSRTGERSTCGLADLRVGSVDGGTVIVEIPYLAISKYFPEVRDVGFDKVPGVGWSWD